MSNTQTSSRTLVRAVLLLGIVVIAAPLLLFLVGVLSNRTTQANAQDARATEERARKETQNPLAEAGYLPMQATDVNTLGPPGPQGDLIFRPVMETEYREQTVEAMVPVTDPVTGKTVWTKQPRLMRFAVTKPRYVKSILEHDQRIQQLAGELRTLSEDDEARQAKLQELRQRLESEFMQMHEKQSEQLAKTEERLQSLKKLHQERGDNKDKIVQRRIDELLGNVDALQWNAGQMTPTMQIGSPGHSAGSIVGPVYGYPNGIGARTRLAPNYSQSTGPTPSVLEIPIRDPEARGPRLGASAYSTQGVPESRPPTSGMPIAVEPDTRPTIPDSDPGGPDFAPAVPQPRSSTTPRWELPGRMAAPPRAEAPTSVVGRLFQLARNSANAESDLAASSAELKRLGQLREKGVLPESEFISAQAKNEKLRVEVHLNKIEFEALSEALHRDRELADAALAHATEKSNILKARVKSGTAPHEQLVEADFEVIKAQNARESAAANLEQLQMARKLIEGDESDGTPNQSGAKDEQPDTVGDENE